MNLSETVVLQREFFASGKTFDTSFRTECIRKLGECIKRRESDIAAALKTDLNKPYTEAYMTEIGLALSDISYNLRHLEGWAKVKRARTPLFQFKAASFIIPEPYGNVLVMAPWNYPFLLNIQPMVGAVAAGNTVIVKPSAYAPATSHILAEIVAECFEPGHVAVIEGGRKENSALLDEKFDYIFFTGSVAVGRIVMEKASVNLTPVTLELGGKSPCIVDGTTDMTLTARRIVSGKLINAGQTCVAPDYILVKKEFESKLIEALKKAVDSAMAGDWSDFPHMVNEKHYERVIRLLDKQNVVYGGLTNKATLFIEPTIIKEPSPDSPVMREEIFGPVLPVLDYDTDDDLIAFITSRPKPLALYLFTENKELEKRVLTFVPFGGGCVNDTLMHLASHYLPFGGVGNSGMGSYHGKKSFDTFTHYKSVLNKSMAFDIKMRYRPYSEKNLKTVRKFLK